VNKTLIYLGSAVIVLWGIGHLAASKSVIARFSSVSLDNYRLITMEWIAEGLALCFVGIVAAVATSSAAAAAGPVLWACVVMLVVMAILSLFTGARTSIVPMRICPLVKLSVATLYVLGSVLQ
jgi:uncharacterized membrane protein YfcA